MINGCNMPFKFDHIEINDVLLMTQTDYLVGERQLIINTFNHQK